MRVRTKGAKDMKFDNYTERSRGLVQAAQGLALRQGHQRFTPEHLLKTLLEDEEGLAANLIRAAGGDPKAALTGVEPTRGRRSAALRAVTQAWPASMDNRLGSNPSLPTAAGHFSSRLSPNTMPASDSQCSQPFA